MGAKTNAFSVLWPSGVFIVLVRKVMRNEEVDFGFAVVGRLTHEGGEERLSDRNGGTDRCAIDSHKFNRKKTRTFGVRPPNQRSRPMKLSIGGRPGKLSVHPS